MRTDYELTCTYCWRWFLAPPGPFAQATCSLCGMVTHIEHGLDGYANLVEGANMKPRPLFWPMRRVGEE